MITTLLQILIPLAYVTIGLGTARLIWQNMRKVPAVYGSDPVNCSYPPDDRYHTHHNSCHELIQESSGDDWNAGMASTFGGMFWPIGILAGAAYLAVTWRTPLTQGEKILAMRNAEDELRKATQAMERARNLKEKADGS